MKNTNKKGFTIVELVIVIAVIAILAAVLIPTFVGLVNKANRAADTALAKELNTALAMNGEEIADFDAAVAALREGGFILANLNAKADGCYFVWDNGTKQILYVDANNNFEVLYSNGQASAKGADWYLTVSNKAKADEIVAMNAGITVKVALANVKDLSAAIAAGGEIYIDESVVLDKDNTIVLDDANKVLTINLGNGSLNTNGIVDNTYPIEATAGTLNINAGVIGASGSFVDDDGRVVNTPIMAYGTSNVNIDGTTFNIPTNGFIYLGGTGNSTVKNATINTENIAFYANGNIVVENTVVNSKGRIIWACNHNTDENTGLITVKSGTYTGGSENWAAIVTCGSFVEIEGGNFTANDGANLFQIHNNSTLAQRSTITITGGTFNGVAFADVTDWDALCGPNTKATVSEVEGVTTVTIGFSAE